MKIERAISPSQVNTGIGCSMKLYYYLTHDKVKRKDRDITSIGKWAHDYIHKASKGPKPNMLLDEEHITESVTKIINSFEQTSQDADLFPEMCIQLFKFIHESKLYEGDTELAVETIPKEKHKCNVCNEEMYYMHRTIKNNGEKDKYVFRCLKCQSEYLKQTKYHYNEKHKDGSDIVMYDHIKGVPFRGIVDKVCNGIIYDWKFSARNFNIVDPGYLIQMGCYALLLKNEIKKVRPDMPITTMIVKVYPFTKRYVRNGVKIKERKVKIDPIAQTWTEKKLNKIEDLIRRTKRIIETDDFKINPLYMHCKPYCDYWELCDRKLFQ